MTTTNLVKELQDLATKPLSDQYSVLHRCYSWASVFINKLPECDKHLGKTELKRIISLSRSTETPLGLQLIEELKHPGEFILNYYSEFISSLFFLIGVEEEDIDSEIRLKAEEAAMNSCAYLVYQQMTNYKD